MARYGFSVKSMIIMFMALTHSPLVANVYGLFPAGNSQKSYGLESALAKSEPQSILYNPGSLSLVKGGLNTEIGVAKLDYGYEHPRFDQVRVSLWSPLVSAGFKSNLSEDLSIGVAIIPTSKAKLHVRGLPRRINGKPESLDVVSSRDQFHVPVGVAYQQSFAESELSLGAALIATYDHRTIVADSLVDGTRLVDLSAKGTFFRPALGGQFLLGDQHSLGLSYTPSMTKRFKGTTTLVTESAPFDTEQVDFDPAILSSGYSYKFDQFIGSLTVNRIFAQSGRGVIKDGINRKIESADVHDVNHLGAHLSYDSSEYGLVSAGIAYLPTYWGAGSYTVDRDGFTHHEMGQLFGNFQGVSLRNQALSWKKNFDTNMVNATIFRSAGKQSIGADGDNPGLYQMEFVSVTGGFSTFF